MRRRSYRGGYSWWIFMVEFSLFSFFSCIQQELLGNGLELNQI